MYISIRGLVYLSISVDGDEYWQFDGRFSYRYEIILCSNNRTLV